MELKEFPVEFVLSKVSDLYCKRQWRSLVLKSVLVEFHAFISNCHDWVCDGFRDGIHFSFKQWRNIFLVKLQIFTNK